MVNKKLTVLINKNIKIAHRDTFLILNIFIPVSRRVKGYTRFVGKYVTVRSLSVCLSVRMNAEISETIRARLLGFSMQIPEIPAHRKFVSSVRHDHFYAHKPPRNFKKS